MIDLGTGDGRAVLERARRDPGSFVIGIDASAAAMAGSSLRAARPPRKGGLPNALFLVASAEQPPRELAGRADAVTVAFPWGSLLRGALAIDDAAAAARGISALLRPGGRATIHLSVDERDRLAIGPLETLDRCDLAERWRPFGLDVVDW